jgi:hypothetical protein
MLNIIKKTLIVIIMFNICSANAIYNKKVLKDIKSGNIIYLAKEFKKRTTLENIPSIIDDCRVLAVSATNQFKTKTIELIISRKSTLKIYYSNNFNYDSNDKWDYAFITKCFDDENNKYKIVIY